MVSETDVHQRISEKLSPSHLEVTDESDGCGAKFLITVVSEAFNGKRVLECHRLVQDAIADVMPQIHAVTINACTQGKWENAQKAAA
ncbi:BolA-like protein [Ancylostoma caninum]|uniref:BolA-like protein n=1 Tax=Ancylostoma caninum TaxID=29170 RepID=A0A368FN27_ANCCA|nr:BolA-like protein [Ancylostoma caninum]